MNVRVFIKLIFAVVVTECAGMFGAFLAAIVSAISANPSNDSWYVTAKELIVNPPVWSFETILVVLYAFLGLASGIIWAGLHRDAYRNMGAGRVQRRIKGALAVFSVLMILSILWPTIFFVSTRLFFVFAYILVLFFAIAATIFVFSRISKVAALLLVPYFIYVAFLGFVNRPILNPATELVGQHACTEEARVCADGSTVVRSGPQCEFAACPEATIDTAWKKFTSTKTNVLFYYPESIGATYIRAVEWPPLLTTSRDPFSCIEGGLETYRAGKTEKKTVERRTYCVTKTSQETDGSVFTDYVYRTELADVVIAFTTTLQAVHCSNSVEPQKTECENERATFTLDDIMGRVMQSALLR
ncbi:MAG: hypothetical protein ACD_81C00186G0016 [uncultured bacterium]|uniref:Integral membrane protein n=1 Tax=Candidatus Wolfebacteria bacterium GW2011_GWE2_44_13 TaxID=1619017 RepID=A0A0G1HB65_9BACT|nr:MAG: hypothetical protein ACD_81C00186G0016 [uncultured bacterium]KKT43768.1 MAG: Integral membrane protein [Candidatus Wolfebacteria bacterium GW2011_GWE2_44_13]